MKKSLVAVVPYERPLASVRKAVELSRGLSHLPRKAKVFMKPNICFWKRGMIFPKWGVITTSRIIEDMVILLKEHGLDDITIGEGIGLTEPGDTATPDDAFEKLGYHTLKKRYGVKCLNIHERPFEKVDLGSGVELDFNTDILQSDFVVNIPVLKTHIQTVVSLGIKNMAGVISIESRQKCHSVDPQRDLHFMAARLANKLPPSFTLLDGIYTTEIGPAFHGRIRRSNILIASSDILSADKAGAKVLGYEPSEVPHLVFAAHDHQKPVDLADIEVVGKSLEEVASFHEYSFPYNEEQALPVLLAERGFKGLTIQKADLTLCTYCTSLISELHYALIYAWKGKPWDNVEILTGKSMQATAGRKKTILIGECIFQANKDNRDIQEMIPVRGCPPQREDVVKALQSAGIPVDSQVFKNLSNSIFLLMHKYAGNPEFDESHFKIE